MPLQKIQMTKDIADAIVQLCFDTNAYERLHQENEANKIAHSYQHPTEVKHSIDQLISADSFLNMQRHFEIAKSLIHTRIHFYKNTPQPSVILDALSQLYTDVIKLETLITNTQTLK